MTHEKNVLVRSKVLTWRWDKISWPNLELQYLNP